MKIIKLTLLLALLLASSAQAQLGFIYQPMSQSASVGADVLLLGTAFGPESLQYQWRKSGVPLQGANGDALFLPNVQLSDAGDYDVVVSGFSGSITSEVATLTVDGQFTKVLSDALVADVGVTTGSAWGDYDNDGDLDIFLTRGGTGLNSLFRNRGDGSFEAVTISPLTSDLIPATGATWIDYDNNGTLDLFVITASFQTNNFLYRNNGDGSFTRVIAGVGGEQAGIQTAAWADYDADGWVDLVAGPTGGFFPFGGLYHNENGILIRTTLNIGGVNSAQSASWTDVDSDGDPDMFFANGTGGFGGGAGHEVLYLNQGGGAFSRVTTGPLVNSGSFSSTGSWADFDGDGDQDVYVGNLNSQVKYLFRNDGGGTFTQILGEVAGEEGDNESSAWGDFDNDGWIDLLVVNNTGFGNFLFRNYGNGVFSKIQLGSITGDRASSISGTWADIDDDGDLDLFVANLGENNFLYRNNGNANAWLQVRLVGFSSNRGAVGAKVRVQATISGESRWQTREIAVRDSSGSPGSLRAEFGLGDASTITTLRVEWPSGLVTETQNVPVRQVLTLVEPPSIQISPAQAYEGDVGVQNLMNFTVRLTSPVTEAVSVDFQTFDDTAIAGTHYVATNGTLSFSAGETNVVLSVPLIGNLDDDTNRTFFVRLSNPVNLGMTASNALGRILDDDPLNITIENTSTPEGTGADSVLNFVVSLLKPWHEPVTFSFATTGSTGVVPGQDYIVTNGTLTIPAGELSVGIPVQITGDALNEVDEVVFLNLSNIVGATPLRSQGTGTIINDDPLPTLSLNAPEVLEGNSGTNNMVVAVTLSAPSGRNVSFSYGTSNGTAASFFDYRNLSGSLTMPAGMGATNFVVRILGDVIPEGTEIFYINLSNPGNVAFTTNRVTAVILDNDFRLVTPLSPGDSFSFVGVSNRLHRVERTLSLTAPVEWQPVSGAEAVQGNGTAILVSDPAAANEPQRFYRVVLLPP